jgi:replicative DNA helicase
MNNQKTIPHSVEAEEQLLCGCLIDGVDVVARCINAELTPASFYVPAHRHVFAAILDLMAAGKEISMGVLAEQLKTAHKFEEVGGYPFLMQISGRVPTTLGVAAFLEKVVELAALREAIRVATALVDRCYAYDGDGIAETLGASVSSLLSLAAGATAEKEKDWDEVVAEAEADLQTMIESMGKNTRREIRFPWARMNELFGPMQRGQLIVLAARASVGKSSMARPILAAATEDGHKAYYVTLEVNPRRVPLQIASSMAGVGLRGVANAFSDKQSDLLDALRSLKGRGVTISSKDRSVARIEARARALHAKGQLDIMFIDHGGYVEEVYKAKVGEKVGACGLLTKTLKRLADELDIVVVLLWQLNRSSVQQGNREPGLTDLKDSGSLEEDADKVILIHRPDTDPLKCDAKQAESMSVDELPSYYQNVIQAKGRDDGTSLLSFYLHRPTATFRVATI